MLRIFCFFIFLTISSFSCKGQQKIDLIKNGKTDFKIIYPKNASALIINAAKQLALHLNKLSKANFVVSEEINKIQSNTISVGNTDTYNNKIAKSLRSQLGRDGIIIKTLDQNLFLNGATEQATLYAIYQFLEEYIKIDFWTPQEFDYPSYTNLQISNINLIFTPPFFYRSHYAYNANVTAEFATILKENGDYQPVTGEWGKSQKFLGWVHTFSYILPPSKYFSQHPEWFADPANHFMPCTKSSILPQDQETQLCLSDRGMQKEFLKQLLSLIKEKPGYDLISVSQNDNKGFCNCSACKEIISEEGGASGLLLRFVNAIAAEVEKEYPNKKIETLAYYVTETPPLKTKPRKNVIVRFAPIDANMAYPLASKQNEGVKANIEKWTKISNQNFFWGYNSNFQYAVLPYPSLTKTLQDIKYLSNKKFQGIFIQDNTNPEGYGYFLDMQAWVIAKTLWNPSVDTESLIKKFFYGYYGKSGQYLLAYYKLIETSLKKSGIRLSAYHSDYSFITDLDINNANLLFKQALTAASGNKTLTERVQKEKISFDYMLTFLGKKSGYEKGIFFKDLMDKTYKNQFVNNALKKYNRTLIEEVETLDAKRSVSLLNKEIKIEQGKFALYRKGYATNIEYDEAAQDKLAATISGESQDWAVQYELKGITNPIKFTVSSSLRIEKKINTASKDTKITFGIYDPFSKKEVLKREISVNSLTGNKYVDVSLDKVLLKNGYIVWFSINEANNGIGHLYIDHIKLKKE